MTRGKRKEWKDCPREGCAGATQSITGVEAAKALAAAVRESRAADPAHGATVLERKVAAIASRLRGICVRCAAADDRAAKLEPLGESES